MNSTQSNGRFLNNTRLLFVGLLISACTHSFEDINTNSNNPSTVLPKQLLAGIQRDMMHTLVNESWVIGTTVIQYTAKNTTTLVDRYIWGERNQIWDAVYDNMRDVNNILKQTSEGKENNYRGVALVLRAWLFSLVTDCYGDIPYTEAIQGKEGILSPAYDRQETIYEGILTDLAEANRLLSDAANIENDFIYGGDINKWRKLANSLRLRYLLRISGRKEVGAEMQQIVANPAEYPLFESNVDNASYTFSATAPDQFPLLALRIGSFNESRASKTLIDKLQQLQDPRLKVFFRPTPSTEATPSTDDEYTGIPNGLTDVEAIRYNGGPDFQSRISPLFYEQSITDKGLQIAKGFMMTYAELQFILAEAAQRKIIISSPETHYKNGIQASFQFYGKQVEEAYFLQNEVMFEGTDIQKLEKVLTQKWISQFFQGFEAWFDWRRTGFPSLKPGVHNENANKIPVRFIYPIIEQSLNAKNRADAILLQGPDDINTRVWWDIE
ncbi:SusD/RagB family nutrient-binding outer membrane lipoprotein [Rhodocytophaga rosea]|uniref:SusD/RagB family nutrient-binding outer membrane lipoprotein n=1 Tax=Rhodocytophaga rosea TaxID=2704465 RepID=A0A6C0GLA5_9BACT|nr:SusD/RagB family nutrient-binding outer membrane lipoprotein [Rhodocytophaga rosea]QHT68795.1 SusD/RagB family nutrient-binding outer membrane lipoprotein [Rhodocytophaga rosea]